MQIQLVITAIIDNGSVSGVKVGGPVDNKMLCYGMLEMAKDAIRTFEAPKVAIANPEQTKALVGV